MRIQRSKYIYLLIAFAAMLISYYNLWFEFVELEEVGLSVSLILKRFFLYVDVQSEYFMEMAAPHFILYFSIILFSCYYICVSSYGITKKYRSMLLLRHKSKEKFMFIHIRKIVLDCLKIALFILIFLSAATYIADKSILLYLNSQDFHAIVAQLLHIFLFLLLCGLVNFYLVLFEQEGKALVYLAFFIGIIIIADCYISSVSILTYGTEGTLMGTVVLISACVFTIVLMKGKINKADIL